MEHLVLGNIRNGLAYAHDDVCHFQSQHGHHFRNGYFRMDAMPYRAVIHLLRGGTVEIVDATSRNKSLTDAQRYGVPTWALVFNRALDCPQGLPGVRILPVCAWQTPHIYQASRLKQHQPLVHSIRKLLRLYGAAQPVRIGENLRLTCHRQIHFDDQPERLARLLQEKSHAF